jgi:hypothetical protein
MAKTTVKAVISVEIPYKSGIEKQTTKERNAEIKAKAEESIIDALTLAELEPQLLRLRIAREKKDA